MKMDLFDHYEGKAVHSLTLENEFLQLKLIDFGARIVSCVLKKNGADVVQGFDSLSGYLNGVRYMGTTVGRLCNRLGKGQFKLNGVQYQTPINNGPNTLHGGPNGFDHQIFEVLEHSESHVVYRYFSKHLEEGFPGNLELKITYRLLEDGFTFESEAVSDEDTLCSITNHAFFNMNGCDSETAMNHTVTVFADQVGCSDADGLTLEKAFDVEGTPFDFRKGAVVGEMLKHEAENQQMINGHGIDHCFVLNGKGLKRAAVVEGDKALMEVKTTMPCMHFYSGNFLKGDTAGKNGTAYQYRSAMCFEPEHYPNAIQYHNWEKPLLKKGEVQKHLTEYHFRTK
ncbi:MAG: galactose mutarotase [Erysipelotrichaceae bacterium]|nr:galactose mutarotase [Erysipelotrichaceae bacterium]